jgi:hypothetical protein
MKTVTSLCYQVASTGKNDYKKNKGEISVKDM